MERRGGIWAAEELQGFGDAIGASHKDQAGEEDIEQRVRLEKIIRGILWLADS